MTRSIVPPPPIRNFTPDRMEILIHSVRGGSLEQPLPLPPTTNQLLNIIPLQHQLTAMKMTVSYPSVHTPLHILSATLIGKILTEDSKARHVIKGRLDQVYYPPPPPTQK